MNGREEAQEAQRGVQEGGKFALDKWLYSSRACKDGFVFYEMKHLLSHRIINIYCDESCHLEHDHQKVMTLGAVWCPKAKAREIAVRIREIKMAHGMAGNFEIKWTKVSPARVAFYQAVLDYFFDNDDLHFRAVVIPDKGRLNHAAFGQSHDDWYYKMYFQLISEILLPEASHHVYLDIKDTIGSLKMKKLHDVLCNSRYDFDRNIIKCVQTVRSHEMEQLQLCDLIIGAVTTANRGGQCSSAKQQLIDRIRARSGRALTQTTLRREQKINILCWEGAA